MYVSVCLDIELEIASVFVGKPILQAIVDGISYCKFLDSVLLASCFFRSGIITTMMYTV